MDVLRHFLHSLLQKMKGRVGLLQEESQKTEGEATLSNTVYGASNILVTKPHKGTRQTVVLVAHTFNTSYSGGRDQEDHGSKPAQATVCKILSQKNLSQKRTGRVAQGEGPEFRPHTEGKKKKMQDRKL
jgi:hypothetical protein